LVCRVYGIILFLISNTSKCPTTKKTETSLVFHLNAVNCKQFGQLTLRKIIRTVATRCRIFRPKCTKFNFGWGSAPDPAGGAYSAPPDPLAASKGPTSQGREGRGRGGEMREGWLDGR